MTLKQMLDHLIYLDRKAAILDRRMKQAKAAAAAYEYEVHRRMEAEGFEPGEDIKHKGSRWGRQVDYYAVVQDPLEFNEWALEHAPHLIQPQVRKAKLNEVVVAAMDDKTPLPPGVGASPKLWVSRRAV